MSQRAHHCPFLNRADDRCSNNFSLDRLDRVFDHCFGSYARCAVYAELLSERQTLRSCAGRQPEVAVSADLTDRPGCSTQWCADHREGNDVAGPFVQITLSHAHYKQSA